MKVFKKIFRSKIYRWGIVPLILILISIITSLIFVPSTSLSVISDYHVDKDSIDYIQGKLLKNEKIKGNVIAKENNLGILSVRFVPPTRVDLKKEDIIIFRIKEKNAISWYAENKYKTGLVYEVPFFPFGFSKINNSKGKEYYFEIESTEGNENNAISLSEDDPILITRYQFPKKEIISSPYELITFFIKKFNYSFNNLNYVFSSLPYFLPVAFYLIWTILKERKKHRILLVGRFINLKTYLLLHVVSIFLFFDLIINNTNLNFITLFIFIFFWLLVIKIYKLDSSITFVYSFVVLLIGILCVLTQNESIVQKASSWIYIFLLTGSIQVIFELRIKSKERKNYKILLKNTLLFLK